MLFYLSDCTPVPVSRASHADDVSTISNALCHGGSHILLTVLDIFFSSSFEMIHQIASHIIQDFETVSWTEERGGGAQFFCPICGNLFLFPSRNLRTG